MTIRSKRLQAAILALVLALQSAIPFRQAAADAEPEDRTFVVTAYYSPLPNQEKYLRGSYEADLRLNGNGTHGASGKAVYAGMLAAPKHYEFGTVIHLEGLGTGTVDDRGGAIVKAGERGYSHDRIDVWMGYGDEGLSKALAWGKRTVKGRIVSEISETKHVNTIRIAGNSLEKPALKKPAPKPAAQRIWTEPVGPNSSTEMVRALSEKLHEIGYLPAGKRDAYDAEIKFALIRFQTDNGLLKGPKDSNAGYYGPATRKALKAAHEEKLAEVSAISSELAFLSEELTKKVVEVAQEAESLKASLERIGTPKENETGAHVRVLQEALVSLGYLDAKPTGIYGPKTKDAVARFQIDQKLVLSKEDPNAGKFGKLTRSKMILSLIEKNVP